MRTWLPIALIALAMPACKKTSSGASCAAAAGQFFKVATATLDADKAVDATTRTQVQGQLPAMRDALDAACTKDNWERPIRDCIAAATDHVAIETCEQALTPAQRSTLDVSARTRAPTP